MENKGLIFIPDISGFSRFVNQTEIEHSRLIIQELLEAVLGANHIGLEVSEIEGDAILFYRYGEAPAMDELYRQVESMFVAFHKYLLAYDLRKYCQCNACLATRDLTLKVITHYGEFTGYNVASFSKLIGRDIIVAHELLKNDIEQHEYWLVTSSLAPAGPPEVAASWMEWMRGAKQTQGGEVPFSYAQLSRLKETLEAEPLPKIDLDRATLMVRRTRAYEADFITLFHATGDFENRARWLEGVAKVEELDHLLPRVGMRCRCVMEDGSELVFTSSYYHISDDRLEFTETEEGSGDLTRYLIEQEGPDRARLTVEYYVQGGPIADLRFRLFRKRAVERRLDASVENLTAVAAELREALAHL